MRITSSVKGVARIEIQKRIDLVEVIMYMVFPNWLIEDQCPKGFNSLNRKLNIPITRITMKKTIELTEQADRKGIQVQIAGRIDRKEIAPKIDYCSYTVRTICRVLGIQIWIFTNEK
ncbi:hypothetical protein MKW94_011926 [Papaver nudicaule]|uniref:Ribosomal protein S3 n=1 Tax=Papaver nudicaule TaxID=74823 RepID=A0AA41RUR8_PAPNU|nr:hypothetical protein [Papaver nudicaule]